MTSNELSELYEWLVEMANSTADGGNIWHSRNLMRAAEIVAEKMRTADETTPLLFPQLSPLGKDCGQGSGHVAVKLLTTNDGTAHACEKCSTMWFVPYGAAVKASETPQHDFRGPTVACRCGWFGHPNALVGLKCPKCSAEFK